ncbi:MAG TPA: YqcI/YcgG family protein [Candidatus Limnocylindrales bacterium]|nr:YqcI/YcgG family protein [Candidatus Limnocylindrales bacterium]
MMLFRASQIRDPARGHPPGFRQLLEEFAEAIGHPGFPCMFAGRALARDEILFAWVPGTADPLDEFLEAFQATAAAVRQHPDQVVVIFAESSHASLDSEREFAVTLLRHLREHDRTPWPADQPTDPADPQWIFWFEGVDFFINFSTPGHRHRRSRNVGSAFTVITQSRSSFDSFVEPGDRVRAVIRERVGDYDTVPVHPALGTFGDPDNREALQFFLGESNECPVELLSHSDVKRLGRHSND